METQTVTAEGAQYNMSIGNLGDIPDLSGISDNEGTGGFQDGWYQGTILEKREFTDKNGSERLFESSDAPSQNGDSRNVRLQVQVLRAADKRTFNTSVTVNYRPDDFSAETIAAIQAQKEKNKESGDRQWGPLFRSFMALNQLGKLQKIAGVRQLQRNADTGGLDIAPLYNKSGWFKLGPDERSGGKYKEVVDFRDTKPTKGVVL